MVGDLIGGAVSSYILWEARRLGAPASVLARMAVNVAIETGVGAIPMLGDIFDIYFRANLKNMALLKRYLVQCGKITASMIDSFNTSHTPRSPFAVTR